MDTRDGAAVELGGLRTRSRTADGAVEELLWLTEADLLARRPFPASLTSCPACWPTTSAGSSTPSPATT